MWPFSRSNTAIVNEKRQQRSQALADVSKDTSEGQKVYLKATASEIVSHIGNGEWTASEVLEAYIGRAAYAHATTNCLTEVMLGPARQRANELDKEFATTKKLVGPLHGVPVSIKDQFEIEGVDSSIGFSQWTNKPAKRNADVVNQLLAAGAVVFLKTNVPQTMFAFECSNPVWGCTTNPYNKDYTCGGSSGGEAALLAMDGSAVGIGSDIGGSLRIPAAYCGIYSLKPASGRVSYFGAKGPVPGFNGVVSVAGPMGRSVMDLELISRITFGAPSTNHLIPPLPFIEVKLPPKLRFAYYTSDHYVKASPACKRAVLDTVDALRNAGHECVELELPDGSTLFNLFAAITSSDGYKTMQSHLGPDKKENSLFLITLGPKLPSPIRSFAAWILEAFVGDKIFADALRVTKAKSVAQFWELIAAKDETVENFNKEVWNKHAIDSIIGPVQALPQLPHGGCDKFSAIAVGTVIYNLLDLPVGCIPVTRVDPAKDQLTEEWVEGPGLGSSVLESGLYRGKSPLYNPEATKGMPVNIQLVGKKWEEEKLLRIMDVVDRALGKERGFGPGAWDAHMKSLKP